ncbi:MAG TPA: hypothetical protein DCQ31_14280 [Bacteroidales bacterium]|nr:hypothetical protein [Bacteroidales bacterium]
MKLEKYSDNKKLLHVMNRIHGGPWPKFLTENFELLKHWRQLYKQYPEWQLLFRDGIEYIGLCNLAPLNWDGEPESLNEGLLPTLEKIIETPQQSNTLCCFSIVVGKEHVGEGISIKMLNEVKKLAIDAGYKYILFPVRPMYKKRYPITPLADYVQWMRGNLPFDPWIRTLAKIDAKILKVMPNSVKVQASVSDWENWTDIYFGQTGDYIIPKGHAPLHIDLEKNMGIYAEEGLWMKLTL